MSSTIFFTAWNLHALGLRENPENTGVDFREAKCA
jgi:hypothetical protein